jgi:hypothetical protein
MSDKNVSMLLITPVDKEAQNEGAWVDYHGVDLKICRSNNPVFKRSIIDAQSEDMDKMSPSQRDKRIAKILSKNIAEGLLVDWDGFPNAVPYTKEAAENLMANDDDCRQFVINFANSAENFYADRVNKTLEK